MSAFEEMGVLPELAKAVDELEWMLPTDVQAEAIPLILGGGDVLMAAETGSGKTGAFCLPIIQIVWETLKDLQSGKTKKAVPGGTASSVTESDSWLLSLYDRGQALAISSDCLVCQCREHREWHGCRSTKGVTGKGKYCYEATVTDEGLCRVGWSTSQATLDLGTDRFGFGFGGTGKKSNNKQFDDYGEPFGINDTIGCFLDLDDGAVSFSKNGVDLGTAFKLPSNLKNQPFFAAVVLKNAEMKFNFGDTPFKFPTKACFVAFKDAALQNIVNNINGEQIMAAAPKNVKNSAQAIIIEPSRELAEQTFQQVQSFKKHISNPPIRELLVIGGVAAKDQIACLQSGVDIIVATPGRLEDLISTGQLSLTQVRFFVLDEADGLLQQGYGKLIDRLHAEIPKLTSDGKRLQMVVCSATLHSFEVKKLAERLMRFPTWVDLKGEDAVPETVHHVVVQVDPRKDASWGRLNRHIQTDGVHEADNLRSGNVTPEMLSEAVKILKGEYCVRAAVEHKMERALIFCRTKVDCDNLEYYFNQLGNGTNYPRNTFSCVCLHSDRSPQQRKENLEKFKRGDVKFLICTDVAARGIDITGMPYVINVTLPDEKSNYVHRIGRVGRAERMGLAISFVSAIPEKVWYHSCSSKGKNCNNTRLTDRGGCCIWYNEPQYLADIEDHLNVTITIIEPDMKVPMNEFDGKVTYGQKRLNVGSSYENHVAQMAPAVQELAVLEKKAQQFFIKRHFLKDLPWLH